ncbi:hypothetical protein [Nocardioides luti]|uniref:hypothetical protein n=1 Tax=Nocardioides luti TaxID=2761101 RepID=UPI001C890A15|nr:hypothetical protein [Nocardioides luti]
MRLLLRRPLGLLALASVVTALTVVAGLVPGAFAGSTGAPAGHGVPPHNRYAGPDGTSSMHGDSGASDTTPYAGPGADPATPVSVPLAGVCPTILAGVDGLPQALCTSYADRAPTLYLLDPATGAPLARLALQKGSLLGGVYAYVDAHGRMVTADGSGDLLLVGHHETATGWELTVDDRVPLRPAFRRACGAPDCDAISTVAPGFDGRVWFATAAGRAGYADPASGRVVMRRLGHGEIVANSIATSPDGVSVVTDHATYLLRAGASGAVHQVWRRAYARGKARKPGQLSHGSGATPTFFGPRTGHELVAMTDNARPREHLLVYRADTGRTVCSVPLFGRRNSGTENSPIGWRRQVYVASTYGYPYPATPDGAGEAQPASADFVGGMQKIHVGRHGCRTVWRTRTASAAVPRLSRAEGVLYTVTRTGAAPSYRLARISPRTGRVLSETDLGAGPGADTLQMVGTILPDGTLLQGFVTGLTLVGAGS